ncbi:hypothetical protein [Paenibacillus konkukensis]|uniref:hypothetical protein n=1 Tax=Paenibacillus konkukensis TaxID=2020716 RepID=UPI00201D7CD9|nr:hypothetical protein [Paenibacillus konkukensis]
MNKAEMTTFDEVGLPDVHFIKQNYKEMGRQAVQSLLSQINGKSIVKHIVVPVQCHLKPGTTSKYFPKGEPESIS